MNLNNHITDSEWQVMRVLWDKTTCSAAEMIKTLEDITHWSPTTIKTFLSRLAAKNLVGFEKQGKKFIYFPKLSERECVISEMKAILNRVYGGKLNLESGHFQFFGMNNDSLLRRLDNHLEKSFVRISKDYDYHPDEKQIVYLYPNQNRLHSALGLQSGPQWIRAGWEWDILHICPEADFTDITIESAIEHVWIQRVIHDINPSVPYWLLQGIATYESNWLSSQRFDEAMARVCKTIYPTTIIDLAKQYDLFRYQDGYELTYTVVKFIITEFGMKSLNQYLRSPQNFNAIFLIDELMFWKKWVIFVQTHYTKAN